MEKPRISSDIRDQAKFMGGHGAGANGKCCLKKSKRPMANNDEKSIRPMADNKKKMS